MNSHFLNATKQRLTLTAATIAVATVVWVVPSGSAMAQKGGGTTPPPNPEISFIESSKGALYVMNADGSNARQVLSKGRNEAFYWPAWSPDGQTLAYWRDSSAGGKGIWAVNIDGTGAHSILATATIDRIDWAAEPAPDGQRKICFTDWAPGSQVRDIYLVNQDGSGLTNLTNTPAFYEANAFWIGSRVAYTRGNQLVAINLALDGGGNVYAESEEVIYDQLQPGANPAASFRGANTHSWIVFQGANAIQHLDFGIQPPMLQQLTTPPSGSVDRWSSFSPTDAKVVFDRLTNGGYSLYTVNADGTGVKKIRDKASQPSWKR